MTYLEYSMKICIKCGVEFESNNLDKVCPDCKNKPKRASFEKLNAKLINDVKQASKLGLSYGKYKGDEKVWKTRAVRSAVQK